MMSYRKVYLTLKYVGTVYILLCNLGIVNKKSIAIYSYLITSIQFLGYY